ncbi:transmembrane protein, putative [Rhizoctonia solani AG-3 Rhs1AP]|uniref:Transmembrane protein, putative n=1 Tax=Rhizoctonia solani AG-3 Rhs1AP TaxID=1086054 RepID=A0A0A1ULV5_9AGAM|nr:transmembrane protein, putative [Rhizoctonia solani AG-3 Rhs1AP]
MRECRICQWMCRVGVWGVSNSACCCSTATYALVSACWVCQTNKSPNQLSRTYQSWWSECPVESRLNGSLPAIVSHMVPRWALVQPNDSKWNMTLAQLAVTNPSSSHNKPPPYAVIAICSVLGLLSLLGMTAWLYRRRNRISPSRPPADFEIDGGATSGLISNTPDRPSWSWWRPTTDKKRANDPGKIDAWRYPFEYEPVSTGNSGPGNGYYDSHRRLLVPRSSMDTLAMQNQSRNHTPTLGYSGSTHNLTTTPVQTYTTLPHGYAQPTSGPGYAQPMNGPGYAQPLNGSGYTQPVNGGYAQPRTYGHTVPYTYPYTQSASSPLSPQYVSPTRTYGHVQSPTHIQSPSHMQSPSHIQSSHMQPSPIHPPTHIHPPSHTLQPTHPTRPTHMAQSPIQGPGSSRSRGQVVMIPVDQMSAGQIEQLRSQFPDLRIKHKRRRRRRGEPETDHEGRERRERRTGTGHERGRTDTDLERRTGTGTGTGTGADSRPRSWSVPAQVEWDGRPRNGVELREKYERRTSGVVMISVGADGVKVRDAREESGRDASNGRRERARARDAGVSLMGGPPPPIRG